MEQLSNRNIQLFKAAEGEAFSCLIVDEIDSEKGPGWLPRLISKHMAPIVAPDHLQWQTFDNDHNTVLIERVNGKECSRLQLDFLSENKVATTIIGSSEQRIRDEMAHWWGAINQAVDEFRKPPPKRKWDCLIGPLPVGQPLLYRIKGAMAVGGMHLPQPSQIMTESAPGFRHGILFNNGHSSWPLMISGTYCSWEEEGIPDEPMPDINTLCLVLSLAMDQPWGPRHNPMGRSDLQLVIPRFADSAWRGEQRLAELGELEGEDEFTVELDIKKWCRKAWEAQKNKSNRPVRNAMAMYQEGMILESSHQSLARIAYVSAIEAISVEKLEKCEACGQPMGITKKFRETAESAGVNYAADVFSPHYRFRSKTVHEGKLDPEDMNWGQHSMWKIGQDDSNLGWNRRLWLLRIKVRSLILDRLKLEDPINQLADPAD